MWEQFWVDFETMYNMLDSKKKVDFYNQLLYRKNIIEQEIKE